MAKKIKFKELSEAEFSKLSPEDQNKYLIDLEKFDKDAIEEEGDEAGNDMQKKAEKFFKENKDYPYNTIFVTSDGNVFHGNLKGKNLVENYVKAGEGLSYKEFANN